VFHATRGKIRYWSSIESLFVDVNAQPKDSNPPIVPSTSTTPITKSFFSSGSEGSASTEDAEVV
jgi:hypothetical protein